MTSLSSIFDYESPQELIRARVQHLRAIDSSFSIRSACKGTRCSPALLSMILAGTRKINPDRIDDLGKILRFNAKEKSYFLRLVLYGTENSFLSSSRNATKDLVNASKQGSNRPTLKKREKAKNLLSDWLHIYVKDACKLFSSNPDPDHIFQVLGGIASRLKITRSLKFLMHNGYLRVTGSGRLVEDATMYETADEVKSEDIQRVHRKALEIARERISQVPIEQREAGLLLIPLNKNQISELKQMTKRWMEEAGVYADENTDGKDALYQLVVNLTPVGKVTQEENHE